jgi:hypothetical protein
MRGLLAREAARLMAEEGIESPLRARSKAAARLGCTDRRRWPGSDEIDTALLEHRRIFEAETQPLELQRLRALAIEAMEFLREFAPRLTGSVLDGTAGRHSPVTLHLFADTPKDVLRKLLEAHLPFRQTSYREGTRAGEIPAVSFFVNETRVELRIYPTVGNGRLKLLPNREESASISEVRRLLASPQERQSSTCGDDA